MFLFYVSPHIGQIAYKLGVKQPGVGQKALITCGIAAVGGKPPYPGMSMSQNMTSTICPAMGISPTPLFTVIYSNIIFPARQFLFYSVENFF
jgi:hypothetical protein